jgi:hypothetical protein
VHSLVEIRNDAAAELVNLGEGVRFSALVHDEELLPGARRHALRGEMPRPTNPSFVSCSMKASNFIPPFRTQAPAPMAALNESGSQASCMMSDTSPVLAAYETPPPAGVSVNTPEIFEGLICVVELDVEDVSEPQARSHMAATHPASARMNIGWSSLRDDPRKRPADRGNRFLGEFRKDENC